MRETKFYICELCGNIITKIKDKKVPPFCCGQKMTELIPDTVEASAEKHIPISTVDGNTVTVEVGSVAHPMVEEHFIEWIYLQTDKGGQFKYLSAGEAPKAVFALSDEKAEAVYAYCNLHGLWKAEI